MTDLQMLTPLQYAKAAYAAERYPNMSIYTCCGDYHLTDSDGRIFIKGKTYKSLDAAQTDRSKILDKAQRA